MTDLFIILLRNKPFKNDTDKLIGKIIHDYLRSKHCQDNFTKIIIEQVLRNEETVLPGLFNLLKNFLYGGSRPMLTD